MAEERHLVRVRSHAEGGPCAVFVPELGTHIVPNPAQEYWSDDPIVMTARWMFRSAEEAQASREEADELASRPVETSTRAPGERSGARRTRRGKATSE